jgi:predicted nucleic acid-binding protein
MSEIGGLRAIFDASVFVRALVDGDEAATQWMARAVREVEVSVPSLVFAEIGNALAGYVRTGRLSREGASKRLDLAVRLPQNVRDLATIVPSALSIAVGRGLSVYDACYAVLADAEDAVLVTADQRLAAAVTRAELI